VTDLADAAALLMERKLLEALNPILEFSGEWDGRHATFVCGLIGHPLVRRVKTQRLECYCGRFKEWIVEDVEDSEGPLTVAELRRQINELHGQIVDRDIQLGKILQIIRPDLYDGDDGE
jgi:hypothetical protein